VGPVKAHLAEVGDLNSSNQRVMTTMLAGVTLGSAVLTDLIIKNRRPSGETS